jgi:predicted RNase H-like HicB family nuclease/predicted RNA binding protein YcfA (HicA-like mRNA interferase family)
MVMIGKGYVRLLEKNGWELKRVQGSHYYLGKGNLTVSVPCHNKDLGKGILSALIKQTGVSGRGNEGMKKIYPAVFHKDEDGSLWVEFPDLPGCLTDGTTLDDAMRNAEEVLGVFIATRLEDRLAVTAPSDILTIDAPDDGFTTYVVTEVDSYRRNTKAVKKTLTIPQWLSEEAERQHISLSALLQSALRRELSVD